MIEHCRNALDENNSSNLFEQGKCSGIVSMVYYITAILDPPICPPDNVAQTDLVRVVVMHMEKNPARLHLDFRELAVEAFSFAWPCKK